MGNSVTDSNGGAFTGNNVILSNGFTAGPVLNTGNTFIDIPGGTCNGCTNDIGIGPGAAFPPTSSYITGAVQLGAGSNSTSNSIQFQGFNFLTSNGNAHFANSTITGSENAVDVYASGAMTAPTMAAGNSSTNVATTAFVQGAVSSKVASIRAGSVTITSSTTATVTFATAMSVAPTSCALNPQASSATTGQPYATNFTTTGFTANVPTSGTLTMTYQCVVNNAN